MKANYLFTFLFSFLMVGINAQELDIEGNGGETFALRATGGSTTWQSFYPDPGASYKAFLQSWPNGDFDVAAFGGDLNFYSGSAYAMRLLANGRLGLGTTTPSAQLHIAGSTSEKLRLEGNSTWISWYNGSTYKGYLYHSFNDMTLSNQLAGNLIFKTNSSTRMNITSAGDIGIGTTSPDGKFEIAHNSTQTDPQIDIHETFPNDYGRINFTSSSTDYWTLAGAGGTTERFNIFYHNGTSGKNLLSIDPNNLNIELDGDVVPADPSMQFDLGNNPSEAWDDVVGDDFINVSDRRLKQNIQPLEETLSKLINLNPVTYEYLDSHNADGRNRTGLIAQEVQAIFPSVVIDEYVDRDPRTGQLVKEKSDILAMNYIELIPIAIKAIQEQQELIKALESRIIELEEK